MQPLILATRSIAAEFFMRIFIPVLIITIVICIGLLGFSVRLTELSAWWWILFAVLLLWTLIATVVLVILGAIIRRVTPKRTKEQTAQTKALVDKLQRLAEVTSTPRFVLLYRIVKDSLRPSERSYLVSLTNEAGSLRADFDALKQSFATNK